MGIAKQHALPGQPINVRGVNGSPVATQAMNPVVHVVDGQEEDVRPGLLGFPGLDVASHDDQQDGQDEANG